MSNEVNTRWLERAAAMIDHWEGTYRAELLEIDLERDDFSALVDHTLAAEAEASVQEIHNYDVY